MTYIDWLKQAKIKKIGQHFTLYDVGYSQTAVTRGIDNTPSQTIINNATLLINKVLEPLRNHFNSPLNVHCIYRSPGIHGTNHAVGGVDNSEHCTGFACDFDITGHSLTEVFEYIKHNMVYNQLIYEGTWVHVSFSPTHNRKQSLRLVGRKYVPA